MTDTQEEWRPVPGHPGIMASSLGRIKLPDVFSHGRHYTSQPTFGCWAVYRGIGRYIYRHSRLKKTYKVAQLVCAAFHGPKPFDKAVTLHLDENSRNNRADNLRWGTQKENLNFPGFLDYCRRTAPVRLKKRTT